MTARALLILLVVAVATASWLATCALWHYRQVAAGLEPLEPRRFERLTLVTLGTGGAYENPQRLGPSTAIGFGDRVVLVDAGRAVAEALRQARIPVAQPDTVFLTSLAPENTVGLDDLLLTGWLAPRQGPLRIVGPPGTRALAAGLAASHQEPVAALAKRIGIPADAARLEPIEAPDGFQEARGDLAVRAAALEGGPLPALAWRFEAAGRSVTVGGPGWGADALVDLARGADVLVHAALHRPSVDLAIEAGTPDPERLRREAELYTATSEVGGLAARAGVDVLVLVRLRPPPLFAQQYQRLMGETFSGRVVVASDGDELTP